MSNFLWFCMSDALPKAMFMYLTIGLWFSYREAKMYKPTTHWNRFLMAAWLLSDNCGEITGFIGTQMHYLKEDFRAECGGFRGWF